MKALSKKDILACDDLPREKVEVPEWGGFVYVRTMTGTERDAFEQIILTEKDKPVIDNIRGRIAVLTIVDEKGNRLFADAEIAELSKKSAKALDRIVTIAQRINGLPGADLEQAVKNSEATSDGDSITD